LVLGAFAPRSHRLVDLAGCRVVESRLEEARQAVLEILTARRVEPFDERRRTGVLRYVVMRTSFAGQLMVTLVAARRGWAEAPAIATAIVAACPAVAAVVLNVNPTGGNRILGEEEDALLGVPFLEDRVGEVSVRLASRSFSQANRAVAGRIYRDIVAAAPARARRAVDAYAGAAPIALSLASVADEIVAIEENGAATAAASAFIAGLSGMSSVIRVVTGDAARCLDTVSSADFIVLDPPRKGCAMAVLAAIGRLRPQRLAYLSCEPTTLARDLAVLVAGGARLLQVTPYDMMPHTPHVETLALLAYDVDVS
jgi:23S rRNA (uracil1939-C5)-methyltransferase